MLGNLVRLYFIGFGIFNVCVNTAAPLDRIPANFLIGLLEAGYGPGLLLNILLPKPFSWLIILPASAAFWWLLRLLTKKKGTPPATALPPALRDAPAIIGYMRRRTYEIREDE